jgi:hypothetical protein
MLGTYIYQWVTTMVALGGPNRGRAAMIALSLDKEAMIAYNECEVEP